MPRPCVGIQLTRATSPRSYPVGHALELARLLVERRTAVLLLGRTEEVTDVLPHHPPWIHNLVGQTGTVERARRQAAMALALGNSVVIVTPAAGDLATELERAGAPVAYRDGTIVTGDLTDVRGIAAVVAAGGKDILRAIRQALAARDGPIVPLITDLTDPLHYLVERAVCIDTTAAGGNATLLAAAGG